MELVSFAGPRIRTAFCAIAGLLAIAVAASCAPVPAPKPAPAPVPVATTGTTAKRPLTHEEPGFLRLSNMPQGRTPVRVGVLLPFSNGSAATRALAKGMMNAAQLSLFDAHDPDILLMPGDEGSTPQQAAAAARTLLAQGAEVIVGPLFASSATAVAALARDRGVPVISFSTDRAVAGNGVYLLSFQPETEVERVISYAATHGNLKFAALIPRTAYGDHVADAFRRVTVAEKLQVTAVERFDPGASDLSGPIKGVVASGADSILIAQGGTQLRSIAALLRGSAASTAQPKLLGTGLWADRSLTSEPVLAGSWFAAPPPSSEDAFAAKYRAVFGDAPAQLAPLAYDAISLVAALAPGTPYHRFTVPQLTDPNGFQGVTGIFRFNPDGSTDRGLAILVIEPDGMRVVDPAPRTFQAQGS